VPRYELTGRVHPSSLVHYGTHDRRPIIINAHIQAVPGYEKELGSELDALVAPSRNEPGVLVSELHFDPGSPGKFMFYEKFQSDLKSKGHPIAAQTLTGWQSFD
jgi:hypothetical protein